jgi:hypothetical protein
LNIVDTILDTQGESYIHGMERRPVERMALVHHSTATAAVFGVQQAMARGAPKTYWCQWGRHDGSAEPYQKDISRWKQATATGTRSRMQWRSRGSDESDAIGGWCVMLVVLGVVLAASFTVSRVSLSPCSLAASNTHTRSLQRTSQCESAQMHKTNRQ